MASGLKEGISILNEEIHAATFLIPSMSTIDDPDIGSHIATERGPSKIRTNPKSIVTL